MFGRPRRGYAKPVPCARGDRRARLVGTHAPVCCGTFVATARHSVLGCFRVGATAGPSGNSGFGASIWGLRVGGAGGGSVGAKAHANLSVIALSGLPIDIELGKAALIRPLLR
ncbi:hypothetical protein BCEP27_190015 [Burkholderia cepacia]